MKKYTCIKNCARRRTHLGLDSINIYYFITELQFFHRKKSFLLFLLLFVLNDRNANKFYRFLLILLSAINLT